MKDFFNPFDDDKKDDELFSGRISFDDDTPDDFSDDKFVDIDTGRSDSDIFTSGSSTHDYEPVRPVDYRKNRDESHSSDFSSSGSSFSSFADEINPESDYSFSGNHYGSSFSSDYEIPHESTDDEFTKKKPLNNNPKHDKHKKSGKSAKRKLISALICIILIIALLAGGFAFNLCSKTDYQPDTHLENQYISESELYSDKNVYNVLIIGTDKRETESTYRSDTMMLVSVDKNTKKIKLTSFLRDSYVYIPAKDFSTKLNASCSYGGPQMVIDTIEYNFKIHIDKYAMIDFDIFKTIIHDLGGVTLTMTEEEAACIRRESGYPCEAGTHKYKAKIALWYARIRHLDSDFKRTERQRKVIQAVLNEMKHSKPDVLITMLNDVLPMVQTDLGSTELMKLGLKTLPLIRGEIEEMQIPAKGTWSNATINGQAVLKMNIEENAAMLKEFIYE